MQYAPHPDIIIPPNLVTSVEYMGVMIVIIYFVVLCWLIWRANFGDDLYSSLGMLLVFFQYGQQGMDDSMISIIFIHLYAALKMHNYTVNGG